MDTLTVPPWTVPPARTVIDCHRLAHRAAETAGGWVARGRAAALDWALGVPACLSPVTKQDAPPADAAAVRDEWLAAASAEDPRDDVTDWFAGAADALGWLVGIGDPPVPLPLRRPDGSLPTADELYAERVRDWWGPEQRAAARREAARDATRGQTLAGLAASAC
jgi:hypothetical protein